MFWAAFMIGIGIGLTFGSGVGAGAGGGGGSLPDNNTGASEYQLLFAG